jgi:integrase
MSIRERTWKSNGEEQSAWICDYVDQHGKRRLKTFTLKKDAEAWWRNAGHEIATGVHAPNAKATVEEIVRQWIANCVDEGLERSTIEQRQRHLKLHIAPFVGRMKLADLTTPRVNGFMDQLRDSGRSVAMRRKVLTSLSTALSFAKGRGLVAQNVALGVKVRSDERHKATGKLRAGRDFPTKAELKLLIDNTPERWRAFIITAVFTGMRASELRGLRWCDVDFENATLRVAQRADTWGKMGPPKSAAGARDIPLTPMVMNALKQWKLASGDSDIVFTNANGRIVAYSNFHTYVWRPLLDACGLDYEFHSLRHAAASLFIETLGWSPKRIQTVMGHSSITMTFDRYGHLFDSTDDAAAMQRLEAAVTATKSVA